jgi:protoporphyrinogen oxidase
MTRVTILGAGMAGLGAAYRLRQEGVSSTVYDKLSYPGGHAASFVHEEGFIFDDGPHISFTKDERMQQLFAESVGGEYETLQAHVNNYWRGRWIKHPAQCNLHGLPEDLLVRVLVDFVNARHADGEPEIRNYADWLLASFGKTFAETFPMVYGLKFHTTTADNMSTDWLGPRLYRPELEEVFRGAVTPSTPDVHYITRFRYPRHNGFVGFLDGFIRETDVRLRREVVKIDPRDGVLRFADGETTPYDHLISSVPLPDLIPLIEGTPADVLDAVDRLAVTTCVIVNVGLDREDISAAHWTYFYDPDIFFTRLSFPHLFSPNNAPPGAGSIQAEVYYSSKYRPLDRSPEACIEPVIRDLRRCGLIRETDRILFRNARLIPYANVIFDLERASALETVHGYLDDIGIRYCGRYGEWGYQWTDDAFKSGESAAEKILGTVYGGQQIAR